MTAAAVAASSIRVWSGNSQTKHNDQENFHSTLLQPIACLFLGCAESLPGGVNIASYAAATTWCVMIAGC
jgi:hypothetical protein